MHACQDETTWTMERYSAFMARDLSRVGTVALFLDGVTAPRPLLCAWTLTWAGERELLALVPGRKSCRTDCAALVQGLRDRGLATPVIVVADGDSHLLRPAAREFPMAIQQRCLHAHDRQEEELAPGANPAARRARRAMRAAHEAPSASLAGALRRDVVRHHRCELPSLTTWFDVTFDACTAYLTLPRPLHRLARTTHVEDLLGPSVRDSLEATCGALHDALAAWPAVAFLDSSAGSLRAAG